MTSVLFVSTIAIVVSGLMVGNEIAVGFFVHPKLWTLDEATHLRAVQPLAQLYGAFMPFWYGATLLTSAMLTYQLYTPSITLAFQLGLVASLLWGLSIIYTLIGPAPINSRVAQWNLDQPPTDWQVQRRRWDQLHQWRVVGLSIAFILITLAGLMAN